MSRTPLAIFLVWVIACSDQNNVTAPDQPEVLPPVGDGIDDFTRTGFNLAHTALSGGATTVFNITPDAFSQPAPNLVGEAVELHEEGDEGFEAPFNGIGLGPVFDHETCEACHVGDGRARPPADGVFFDGMLFRASLDQFQTRKGPVPIPGFGTQLQLRAIMGFTREAEARVRYTEKFGRFADGTGYRLQVPDYSLRGVYRPFPGRILFSPRVAPVVFGLGLLEAVSESDVLANADRRHRDRDRDDISGRPNYVWDAVQQRTVLGRFGWKANTPNLFQQAAGAYNGDMGITSSLFPAETCEGRRGCEPHAIEVDDETVNAVAFYTRTLGVPARRDLDDPKTQRGEQLFYAAGCDGCHTPTLRTGRLEGVPAVSNQIIHPYTDLLLHDMGPALADGRPDFLASGSEFRTPPLWGIGLVSTVNLHTNFLHDGRARNLLEAVLWHGGEAERARQRVLRFSRSEREALVAFLTSL